MKYAKIALYIIIAILVALFAGFLWGRAGLSAARAEADDSRLRLDLAESRADLLAARVDLFEVNFGRASQRLEAAKNVLRDASGRLGAAGRQDAATRVNAVVTRVEQAQQQVGRLDQSANTRLAEAIALLEQAPPASGK